MSLIQLLSISSHTKSKKIYIVYVGIGMIRTQKFRTLEQFFSGKSDDNQ